MTYIQGVKYTNINSHECIEDIVSKIYFTYRTGFPSIGSFTNDIGWGCMIRSGQMLLANTLLLEKFGRSFRLNSSSSNEKKENYFNIISLFLDSYDSPYSIQNIVTKGTRLYQKYIGEWYLIIYFLGLVPIQFLMY